MQNFKLIIEYDGTGYHGWQSQSNTCTIQGTIEDALKTMTGQSVTLIGSGRTDAGVHATGQVANFRVETRLTSDIFARGLNSLLPSDIVIKDCATVDETFHARYDARSKVYDYRVLNRPIPAALFRQYAWHVKKRLDLEAIRTAILCLEGQHDFSAFEAAGSPRSSGVRTIINVNLTGHEVQCFGARLRLDGLKRGTSCQAARRNLAPKDRDGYVVFRIEADGFLRHMVRNIVGTLVDVGLGKISPEAFKDILISKDRKQAGATAPAHGLCLEEVKYV
ncbi:MAG: tRNA pseudouridine(38-40) synthase TruA [Desulfobacterales bacterium]|nr:tRNA pseudouridine(38-40) synthase TruA [Desulfobacterales bacterium]